MTATSARAAAPRGGAGGLSLGTRIFLISSLLVVLAVGAAVVYTSFVATRVARRAALRHLTAAHAMQSAFVQQRSQQLAMSSSLFVGDAALAKYLADSMAAGDTRSVLDLLGERQQDLGYDFAVLVDPQGRTLARTDQPGAAPGADLSSWTLIAQALEQYQAWGATEVGGKLYDGVVVPVTINLDLFGFLATCYAISDATAAETERVSGTDFVVVADRGGAPVVVATTLDGERTARLVPALRSRPDQLARAMGRGEVVENVELDLGGEPWIGLLAPLLDAAGKPVGATVALASLDRELAPFQAIEQALAVAGVASVLLAFVLTFFVARRTLRPVRRLVAAAAAARAGDYDQPIPAGGGGEVGELAAAFDGLLSELREKRDMEHYVTDLSRSLPEGGVAGAAEAAEPAAGVEAALLAVEYRDLGAAAGDPKAPLDRLSRHLRRLAHFAGARRGEVAAVAGHRALARFEGEGRAFRALATAADVLGAADGEGGEGAAGGEAPPGAPVAAVATGAVARGPIDWGGDRRPGLVGRPLAQLEGLLREGAGGEVAFADDVFTELRSGFERAGYRLAERRGVVTPRPLYIVNAQVARRLVGGEPVPAPATTAVRTGTGDVRPTLSRLAPGRVVGGRFELLAVLGSGGMGLVYKARDRELDEVVAVKMLRPDLAGDGEQMARLKDELKLARKITHPNVVRTYDFDEADGLPFISMEYVRGVTLRYLLDKSGRPPYSAGLHLVRQLCRGLAAAHAVGVLHRDIKPENLILEPNGNAKLMDFGIARPAVRLTPGVTAAGWLVGTPRYLSPEQLQGKDGDLRSDIYSTGVVAYEVFTGALPFVSESVMEAVSQTLREEPTAPHRHWPEIPPELEKILLTCLRKAPEERYPDVSRLLADLDRLKV